MDQSRESLQELGSTLIAEGWDKFCWGVLNQANWKIGDSIVVDGIRHLEGLQNLKLMTYPAEVLLVFVKTDDDTILKRLERQGIA